MECDKCRQTLPNARPVPGEGPTSPGTFVFVGEAPGREENEQGRPFVGGAGRVLNWLLQQAGLPRREVYITNVVKCRPPNNRVPTMEEIGNCLPYLIEELQTIHPKTIVALGETAALVLTHRDMAWRGNLVDCVLPNLEHLKVLVSYHPAYVMRNRVHFPTILCDFDKLLNPIEHVETHRGYRINPPEAWIEEAFDHWSRDPTHPVAVDIETAGMKGEGLDPFNDAIVGIAFCRVPGGAFSLSLSDATDMKWSLVKKFLEGPCHKIFQNNIFDRKFLLVTKGIWVNNVTYDTFDAQHIIYSDSERSLDYLRSLHTNVPPYKRVYKKRTLGVSHLSEADLGTYACLDVDVTKRVAERQRTYLTQKQRKLLERILRLDEVAIKMFARGVAVDKNKVAIKHLELQPQIEALEIDIFKKYGVQASSPKQVSELLFKQMKLTPPREAIKGKTGFSVDEKALKALRKGFLPGDKRIELVDTLLHYRELTKIHSTYVVGLFSQIKDDGRVHPDWKPTGTDTGRWSCLRPNMQNIPKELRDMFLPGEGKVFFGADYDRLELFVAFLLAEEHRGIELLEKGVDIHQLVQDEIQKVYPLVETLGPVQARLRAKAVVFGGIYLRSTNDMAMEFGVSRDVVETWVDIFLNPFPKLKEYRARLLREHHERGYLETPFGRRKYCQSITQAANFPIQSVAVDICLNALLKLEEEGFDPVLTIHDSNVVEQPDNSRFDEFRKIMETSTPELYHKFPVTAKIGTNWREVS